MTQEPKTFTRYLLDTLLIAAGTNHLWHTSFYVCMMPPYLPAHLAWFTSVAWQK
jgi:uncharacterized membrane protein